MAFRTLLGDQRAAMVFTDPPYNVPIDGHATGLGAIHHRSFAMAAGEMSRPAFAVFLATGLRHLAAFCVSGALLFVCMDWRHIGELLAAGSEAESRLENLCVWVKDNAGMGSLYRSMHELVFVLRTGRSRHRNNVQLGRFGRNRTNVWHYRGVNSFGRETEEGSLLALHPTVKPVALVADAILDCTERGDIVLDGFVGSGTTLIAAERTGRRGRALELDPGYVDTAIRRWQALTGGRPAMPKAVAALTTSLPRRRPPMPDDNDDYEVGYARPPRHSRFVKGQSGNPRGRPHGAENIKTLLNEALNELVAVTDHGGRRKVSKRKAFITQIVNGGAKGNFRAVPILLAMLREFGADAALQATEPASTEADQQIIRRIKARLRGEEG